MEVEGWHRKFKICSDGLQTVQGYRFGPSSSRPARAGEPMMCRMSDTLLTIAHEPWEASRLGLEPLGLLAGVRWLEPWVACRDASIVPDLHVVPDSLAFSSHGYNLPYSLSLSFSCIIYSEREKGGNCCLRFDRLTFISFLQLHWSLILHCGQITHPHPTKKPLLMRSLPHPSPLSLTVYPPAPTRNRHIIYRIFLLVKRQPPFR